MDEALFAPEDLVRATGGVLLGSRQVWLDAQTFFIDSRKVPERGIFVPLRGENTDGHRFVFDVAQAGGRAFMMSTENRSAAEDLLGQFPDVGILVVQDTLQALGDLAAFHLDRFPNLIRVGITGSNGKTTTKEMVGAILARKGRTYSTAGNLNSEIGLPLTVLGLREGYEFAVLEMGTNHPGEIGFLARVARPFVSVITNIGTAHIGILGSRKGIALEKKQIFAFSGPETHAVLPEDDEFFSLLKAGYRGNVHVFSLRRPEVRILASRGLEGTVFSWKGLEIVLPLPGLPHVKNALAALTVGEICGVDAAEMKKALEGMKPLFGRGELIRGPVTVLQDCYNANFDSMMGLLDTVDDVPWEGNKVFVLGSMKELGDQSPRFHDRLGQRCAALKAGAVFFFGDEAQGAYRVCRQKDFPGYLFWTADFEELEREVKAFVKRGDLLVLKGSRATALERLSEVFSAV